MSGPTVAFATLGCRLNQVESQEMRALVEQAGYRAVEPGEAAQVYVVNTCTVTSRADFSDRQVIRRILRASPEARVVVTGCLAQTDPDTLARMFRTAASTAAPSASSPRRGAGVEARRRRQ